MARRVLKTFLVLALTLVVAIGGYVGYVAVRSAQPVTLPAPTGASPVGRTTAEWTDHASVDPLAPQPGMPRELSVWLWYPASLDPGAQPAPYAPGLWAGLRLGGPVGLAETGFDHVHDHAFADVPVAAGRFPVVVLEPGLGFAAPQYTAMAENLASSGFLVAGGTPTYSANLTVLNGRPWSTTEAGNPRSFDASDFHAGQAQADGDRLVDVWAADARFAANQLATLDATGRFAGHVDTANTVYIGHSFGGAAALEACRTDQHCAGAADLDGTQYGPVAHTGPARPMLLVASENSCVTGTCPTPSTDSATARTLLSASTGPIWCYRLDGATALTITNAYLTAFVDHVAHGRSEALLSSRQSPYPEVEVQRTGS